MMAETAETVTVAEVMAAAMATAVKAMAVEVRVVAMEGPVADEEVVTVDTWPS